jgi:signal peptidase
MTAVKRTFSILVNVLLWAVILLAALFAFTTLATRDDTKVSNVVGYTPLSVLTDSMSPTFNSGDLIFIKKCDPSTLQVGDIITFHTIINNEFTLNTHRIHEITDNGGVRSYTTMGDNNAVPDTHIIADGDIVGKYVGKLGGFGRVMDFLSSSTGFLCVIVLPMLLFFIYQVYHLIMVSIQLKKAVALETAEQTAAAVDSAAILAETERLRAETAAAEKARAEAEAALAEARRLNETAEEPESPPAAEEAPAVPAAEADMAEKARAEAEAALAEAERLKAEVAAAEKARAEAEAALAEARRLKEAAEAALAEVKDTEE